MTPEAERQAAAVRREDAELHRRNLVSDQQDALPVIGRLGPHAGDPECQAAADQAAIEQGRL